MERDPNSLTDDLATWLSAILALDPEHDWQMAETGTTAPDFGFGNKLLTFSNTPTRQVSDLYGGYATRFNGTNQFGSIASSVRASGTTFTILALIRPIYLSTADDEQAILAQASGPAGFFFDVSEMKTKFGADVSEAMPALPYRQSSFVMVRVEDGVASHGLNGVVYEGGGETITTFTPDRIGGVSAGANRFSGDLSKVVYLPDVLITDEQFAALWAQRYPCLTATTALVNQALLELGDTKGITTALMASPTGSNEAVVANRVYATAIDAVLRDFQWPFATAYATLELVSGVDADDPSNSDWTYAYRAPARMIEARRIVREGYKRSYDPAPPAFIVGGNGGENVIFTDTEDAELEYTKRPICAASQTDPLFRRVAALRLAVAMGTGIAKDESIVERCRRDYEYERLTARMKAANEQQKQSDGGDPSWITNR